MKSDFLRIIQSRGFFHQATDLEGLDALMATDKITGYIGFDMTANSLHVGNLVQIMMLRWLQKTGHRPLILLGGATSKVGDPSFKDTARQLLDDAVIQANTAGIRRSFAPFVDMDQVLMLNNDDWLNSLNYIDFLRDYGRHFSVNRMLAFDSVKLRLEREQSLSFLEFNYMILQAYDFLELFRRHGCVLQMGGVRPVGQYCQWRGTDAPAFGQACIWVDFPAHYHLKRDEDGENSQWGGLAECRPPVTL